MKLKIKIFLIIAVIIGILFCVLLFNNDSNQKDYSQLIDNNEYQVFLFKSRLNFPLSFVVHPWFVLNNKGEISRWEIRQMDTYGEVIHWGYLYKDRSPFFKGTRIFTFSNKLINKIKLVGEVEGEEASKIINFIQNSPTTYPFSEKYILTGPNSNTYIQWVINNFPDSNLKLPWNAFGKNYKE